MTTTEDTMTEDEPTVVIDQPINGYLPWSPQQIRDQAFGAGTRRNPGVNADDVNEFKVRVSDEIAWLHGAIRDLQTQLLVARAGAEAAATGELPAYTDVDEQALQLRISAQDEADRIIAAAEEQAGEIVADANVQADEIVQDASAHGRQIVESRMRETVGKVADPVPESGLPERLPVDRIAETLPTRLAEYDRLGESITADVERLEAAAAAAREHLQNATDAVRRSLLGGSRTTQHSAAQTIPGEHDEPVSTPDPPG